MDKPNGFDSYLVKTTCGNTYLVGNPTIKKNTEYYYDSIYYDCASIKGEEIVEWVGVDDTIFNQREKLIRQTFELFVQFHKEMRMRTLDSITPEFIENWLTKNLGN